MYLLLDRVPVENDADRRKLYVGMTRAKENLYIHCNTDIFDACRIPAVEVRADPMAYPPPAELTLQLTHRDVVLDFFKGKKAQILRLHSGDSLELDGDYLIGQVSGVPFRAAKFSRTCAARIRDLRWRGYRPNSANVRFVVAWKGPQDERETAVLLADLHFRAEDRLGME